MAAIGSALIIAAVVLVGASSGRALEALVLVAVLWTIIRPVERARAIWQRSRAVAAIVTGLFTAILLGHLWFNSFPFVIWDMYSNPEPSQIVYVLTLQGRTNAGAEVPIIPSRLLTSMAADRFVSMIQHQVARMHLQAGSKARATSEAELDASLDALGRLYNEKSPTQQLSEIELLDSTVDLNHDLRQSSLTVLWVTRVR